MSSADVAGRTVLSMCGDLAALVDVERPAVGEALRVQHAVLRRHRLVGIAQQREVGALALGERHVAALALERVDAGHEVGHVELADLVAVGGQRLALDGAALGERLREPRHDHGLLAAVVGQLVRLAVGAGRLKSGAMSPTLSSAGVCAVIAQPPVPSPVPASAVRACPMPLPGDDARVTTGSASRNLLFIPRTPSGLRMSPRESSARCAASPSGPLQSARDPLHLPRRHLRRADRGRSRPRGNPPPPIGR